MYCQLRLLQIVILMRDDFSAVPLMDFQRPQMSFGELPLSHQHYYSFALQMPWLPSGCYSASLNPDLHLWIYLLVGATRVVVAVSTLIPQAQILQPYCQAREALEGAAAASTP